MQHDLHRFEGGAPVGPVDAAAVDAPVVQLHVGDLDDAVVVGETRLVRQRQHADDASEAVHLHLVPEVVELRLRPAGQNMTSLQDADLQARA